MTKIPSSYASFFTRHQTEHEIYSIVSAVDLMNRSGLVEGRVPVVLSQCRRRTVIPTCTSQGSCTALHKHSTPICSLESCLVSPFPRAYLSYLAGLISDHPASLPHLSVTASAHMFWRLTDRNRRVSGRSAQKEGRTYRGLLVTIRVIFL
jgi:hypothetical protein